MQPDNELVALKPQWALNRKGASSFSASKGDHHHHHHESDKAPYHSAFIADLRAPQPSSHRPSNSHTASTSPSPSSASASGPNRGSSYFAPSATSGHHHSQQPRDVAGSWKPAGAGNLPSSSSSPLLAPVGASPRVAAPAPATATAAAARRNAEFSDFGQPARQHTNDCRPAVQEATPTAGGAAATAQADSAWPASGSNWNSSKGAAAAVDVARNGQLPLQQQRPASAALEPASPPISSPAAKQAVYQKVVFEKEFPSLKDSKHPLGYAPKEAPYKQTFLSSRVTGNWTSKLADVLPTAAVQHTVPAVAVGPAPADQLQNGPSSKGRGSPGPGADGSTSGSGAPTPTASGWGSFAQAAGIGNGGAAGAAGANGGNAAANGLSDDKLREQLAMKQSKQLIPVIARKDDSGANSGAVRGRQTVLGGMGGGARSLATAAATTAKTAPPASAQSTNQLGGKFLLSSGGSAVVSNGTVLLTKRAAAPLDKPLMPMAAATAPAPNSQQQEAAAGGGTAVTMASGQSAVDAAGGEVGRSRVCSSDTGQPDLQQSLPRAQSAALPAKSSAYAAFGEDATGGGGHDAAGAGQWRGNGMHELLVPEQGSRQGYAVAYSALVDGVADRGAGGKVAVLLPVGNTAYADKQPPGPPQQQRARQEPQPIAAVPAATLALRQQQSEQPRSAGLTETLPSVATAAAPTSPAAVSGMPAAAPLPLHPARNSYLAAPQPAQPDGEEPDHHALELAELASYLPGDLLAPAGDPLLNQQQEQTEQPVAAAAKFLVPSEEEEFLRSLGWTDADDGTDDVLTEEEIAAFQASAQARACSPGLTMMQSTASVPAMPVSPLPAASLGPWGTGLTQGHGFAPQSLFKTAAAAAHTSLGGAAMAVGGSDGLQQPLGCRAGGFGALPATALVAGERRPSNTDLRFAGARSALPLAVPRGAANILGPAASGPKRGPIAARSFGSEVSVTDSDDL